MGPGVVIAMNLIMQLIDRAGTIGALIQKAQTEKRDITPAELDALAVQDDAARAKLVAAIAAARTPK